jgi:UDP-glucose 4-epimerase
MAILVTGGAGFIGSHTCVELLEHGFEVVVADNYANSSPAVVGTVQALAGGRFAARGVDLLDAAQIDRVFSEHRIDAVIHFAARKSVPESVSNPAEYYRTNVAGTINLVGAMLAYGVRHLVFSSSCSVYGDQYSEQITERARPVPTNPYARSKLICEQILGDVCAAHPDLSVLALRFFNPVGAHPSGSLGESPAGAPANLMPRIAQTAAGHLDRVQVFGTDYPTKDGSAVRDYIHVMDVAEAHRIGLEYARDMSGMRVLNIGTGHGVSVLELINTFQDSCGVRVRYEVTGRRPGDVASLIADPSLADQEWGWRPTRQLQIMCRDAWRFEQRTATCA